MHAEVTSTSSFAVLGARLNAGLQNHGILKMRSCLFCESIFLR